MNKYIEYKAEKRETETFPHLFSYSTTSISYPKYYIFQHYYEHNTCSAHSINFGVTCVLIQLSD